jgi:hypothetical protein
MLKIIFKIFLMFCFIISFPFILYSCACNCGSQEEAEIPSPIIKKADQIIVEKTGKEFFEAYVDLDLRRSKEKSDHYVMVYRLIIPDKPYVNEVIEFSVDKNGNLLKEKNVSGIPNCIEGDCVFDIDEGRAREIAKEGGLEDGIVGWKTAFTWNAKHSRYVWQILSTEYETKGSEGYKGNGEEILIDANSGKILEKNEWFVR